MRIDPTMTQKEETYQVILDIIKNTSIYKAFLATANTEAEIAEEERHLHETHEHLVTAKPTGVEEFDEFDGEPANRPTGRRRPSDTAEEQLAVDTMQEIKNSKKPSRSQPHAGGSSEGTGITLGVHDESTIIFTTSSEGIGTIPGVLDEKKKRSKMMKMMTIEALILKKTDDDEETDDEYVYDDDYVHNDEDEEMKDAEVDVTGKDDDEVSDAAKADAEKTEEVKGDYKKVRLIEDCQLGIMGLANMTWEGTLMGVCMELICQSGLAQMATKGNLGEVVTTCERSWVQASPWGFPSGAKKEWGLSPKAKVRVLHTAQLDVTVSSNH
nr:hypothetical protein [Tanacetum cinerariifolium]